MNSLILRGYGQFDRIITRGYGTGWLGRARAEIVRFVSAIARVVNIPSRINRGC